MGATLSTSKPFWLSTTFQVYFQLLIEVVIIYNHWLIKTLGGSSSRLRNLLFSFIVWFWWANNLWRQVFLILKLSIHIPGSTIYYARLRNSTIRRIDWLIQFTQYIHWILHVLNIVLIRVLQVGNILTWKLSLWLNVLANRAHRMGLVVLSIHHIGNHWVVLGLILILIIFHQIFIICMLIAIILTNIWHPIFGWSKGWNAVVMSCYMS